MNYYYYIVMDEAKENLESALEHLKSVNDELHRQLETERKLSQDKLKQEKKEREQEKAIL